MLICCSRSISDYHECCKQLNTFVQTVILFQDYFMNRPFKRKYVLECTWMCLCFAVSYWPKLFNSGVRKMKKKKSFLVLPHNGHQCHDSDSVVKGLGFIFIHDPVCHFSSVMRNRHFPCRTICMQTCMLTFMSISYHLLTDKRRYKIYDQWPTLFCHQNIKTSYLCREESMCSA